MGEVIAGRYEILELIGRGGMGTVYKARQRTLDRIVAVKMLSDELASDLEFRARFQQEAAVLARLNHPAIVQIFDIEPHADTFCIIMEYVEGETLQAMVNRLGALPEHKMLQLTAQVARGLAYAHRVGVVHRDVKPDNILISSAGVARIMDFGIAHVKGSTLKTQTGISMGTPRYMSPEQVTGRGVDGQADLYCLGLCLYFGLTGQPPFDGDNPVEIATKQVYEIPPPPSAIFTAISPATDDAVMRSIAKSREDRWPDGDAMADGLEAILRQREFSARHSGIPAYSTASMTGPTPVRVVLADPGSAPPPSGITQRMPTSNSPKAEKVVGDTPVTGKVQKPTDSSNTPVPGLVPLTPLPADFSDFEVPHGQTPPHGTPRRGNALAPDLTPVVGPPLSQDPNGDLAAAPGPSNLSRLTWGLVLVLVLGIVIYYAWPPTSGPAQPTRGQQIVPGDSALAQLERETMVAISAGRLLEMIKAWQDFVDERERKNPSDPALPIAEEYIRWLRSQIAPLQATDELVRRRLDRAQYLLSIRRPAVAAAYTEKTVDLFGRSSSYNERVENLRRLIERDSPEPDPGKVSALIQRATQALTMADGPTRGPLIHPEEKRAESLLLEAVQADPMSFDAWMAAGRFYLEHQYLDDARVFFMTAVDRATNGAERGTATQALESLPNQ
jgi:serine/threonine protein kinase